MTLRDERTWSQYCALVQPEKSGQVRTGVKYYFSSTVSPTLFKFGPPPNLRAVSEPYLARNSTTLPSGGIKPSSRFSWRKVWTGVKCNFSSPHHHVRKIVGKLSNRRFLMWNFTRIGPKTKKLWLSVVPARRPSWAYWLRTTPKRCELQLFFAGIRQAVRRLKALHLGRLNMEFQQNWPKNKKVTALLIFWLKS